MYEELMPYWKELCRKIQEGKIDKVAGLSGVDPWVHKIYKELGLNWQWVGEDRADMLVGHIMLFTWEQGIAE